MRTIYVDSDFKCHTADDGTMTEIQTSFFDGKCDDFVEGYCCDDSKGYRHFYPWKNYSGLDRMQRQYERQLIATYEAALETVGVTV